MGSPPGGPTVTGPPGGSHARYALALVVTVVAVLSQYFVPQLVPATDRLYGNFFGGLFVVYGIPILAFLLLVGLDPVRRWSANLTQAALPALGWYGALSAVAFLVTAILVVVYYALDPSALTLLSRPNPVVVQAASDPWFWVAFSFVIGAVEELIFRGWIFGYWIRHGRGNLWVPAIWTSALFAALHLYYGATYLAASPLIYPDLFLLGLAFALAVRSSRGNLVWVALLHGANDATAFLQIVNSPVALSLHYGLIAVGAIVAIYLYVQQRPAPPPAAPSPWAAPSTYPWATPPFAPPPGMSVRPPPGSWPPPPPGPPPPAAPLGPGPPPPSSTDARSRVR